MFLKLSRNIKHKRKRLLYQCYHITKSNFWTTEYLEVAQKIFFILYIRTSNI